MVDFADNAEQAAFREEVRTVIRERMPQQLKMRRDEAGEFRREARQFLALGLDLGVAQGNHCPQCGQVIWQIGGRFEHEHP